MSDYDDGAMQALKILRSAVDARLEALTPLERPESATAISSVMGTMANAAKMLLTELRSEVESAVVQRVLDARRERQQ